MRKFGYARVSTNQQSLDLQIDALLKAGVDRELIYTDKATGKNVEREGLKMLELKPCRGDQILVTKLDRLGRDLLDMIRLIKSFKKRGVTVHFIQEGISTEGPTGELVVNILAVVAQSERNRILERTNEGRKSAQKKGIHFGPKFRIDRPKVIELKKSGIGASAIAAQLKMSRSAVYKILKEENYT